MKFKVTAYQLSEPRNRPEYEVTAEDFFACVQRITDAIKPDTGIKSISVVGSIRKVSK